MSFFPFTFRLGSNQTFKEVRKHGFGALQFRKFHVVSNGLLSCYLYLQVWYKSKHLKDSLTVHPTHQQQHSRLATLSEFQFSYLTHHLLATNDVRKPNGKERSKFVLIINKHHICALSKFFINLIHLKFASSLMYISKGAWHLMAMYKATSRDQKSVILVVHGSPLTFTCGCIGNLRASLKVAITQHAFHLGFCCVFAFKSLQLPLSFLWLQKCKMKTK